MGWPGDEVVGVGMCVSIKYFALTLCKHFCGISLEVFLRANRMEQPAMIGAAE